MSGTAPLRVAFTTPKNPQSATSRYRCHHIAEALRYGDPGVVVTVSAVTDDTIRLQAPDIVVLHRLRFHGEADRVLAAARKVGAVTVASVDDLIFSPEYAYQAGLTSPPDDPAFYRYHRDEADDHLCTLRAADAALVSTEFLAGEARAALGDAKPVACLQNVLNDEMIALADAAALLYDRRRALGAGTLTLGYLSGSPTHDVDFAEIAAPLARLMAASPQVRLLLVGTVTLPTALQPFADAGRIRRHPFVPWRDLFGLIAQTDVALAPLDASRLFNHSKSAIKLLESGAVGVPSVASKTAGIEGVIEHLGLSACSEADWEAAPARLRTVSADASDNLRGWVRANATTRSSAGQTAAVFRQFAALKSGQSGASEMTIVRPMRERVVERLREAEASWMRRGIRLERHWRLLRAEIEKRGS